MKKIIVLSAKIGLVIAAVFGRLLACLFYPNWSAERRAKAFGEAIAIGSDISLAVERMKDKTLLYATVRDTPLIFPGLVFDKAVCEVSVDSNRKVTAKHSEMEYD